MIFLLLFLFLPIRLNAAGAYNQFTNTISCVPEACAHEVGHKLDDLAGIGMAVSTSEEWARAMDLAKPPAPMVGSYGNVTSEELYAELFQIGIDKGYMPSALARFYDLELGNELLSGSMFRRSASLNVGTYPEAAFVFYYYEHMEEDK